MSSAQLSNTVTTGKGNIKYKYHQKLVDTSSHLLPACNTPFNQGWSIITQAKILGTDFQPDSYGVLADPLAELVDMSRFLQHVAPGLSEWAFFFVYRPSSFFNEVSHRDTKDEVGSNLNRLFTVNKTANTVQQCRVWPFQLVSHRRLFTQKWV